MSARFRGEISTLLTLLAVLALTAGAAISAQRVTGRVDAQAATDDSDASSRSSPVMFVENAGQWDERARFQVWGAPAGTMWLAEDAIWITVVERAPSQVAGSPVDRLQRFRPEPADLEPETSQLKAVNIKLSFVDANPHPRIEPFGRLDTVVSYFIGNEPDQWRPAVPVWGGVRYVDLYPGVDLEITSEGGQMVQRLTTRPGADLEAVRLWIEGADAVAVDGETLRLGTAEGEVAWPLLRVDRLQVSMLKIEGPDVENLQPLGVQAFDIAAPFAPANADLQSAIANPQSPADNPADLLYGTFLGGNVDEWEDHGLAIAVNTSGAIYVTGQTDTADFPTSPGAFDRSYNGGESDAFVAMLNPSGTALTYATFLGGSNKDWGAGIAADGSGAAYVTGGTASADFPTTSGAFDRSYGGGNYDVFVVKLNAFGSALTFATFLGGSSSEWSYGIAVDGSGAAYVTGWTWSSTFPTTSGAFDQSFNGASDAFVVKLNASGSTLAYGTFLGGSGGDTGADIAVGANGAAYVTGGTASTDFPTSSGAFDRSYNGGGADAFVVKLSVSGSALAYATFVGGSNGEGGSSIAIDGSGAAYITGETGSTDFPTTPGAFDRSYNGGEGYNGDAFVVKLDPSGSTLVYGAFLGGSDDDGGGSIALDGSGAAYITGETRSANFPATPGAFDRSLSGTADAFVAKVNVTGSALVNATFLGGSSFDYGYSVAVDNSGVAHVTGLTYSADFPTTPGAFDRSKGGYEDAYVVKLAMGGAITPPTPTPTPTPTPIPTYTISGRVTDTNGAGIPGVTVWAGFPRNTTTDANGYYTFTGLPAGTYTIRPDKEPCTFAPATQTVTVPPGMALPDFTSTRLPSGLDVCILEPGDILLKAGAPVGDYTDLIRLWIKLGGSYFTHSALYLGVTHDPQNPAQTGPRIAEAAGKKKFGGSREDEVWETWLVNTQWWTGTAVTDWAVVRPVASSEAKATAIQYARDKAADPDVVFSFLTDLDDEQEFYCSKLVWKSYQRAGLDVHRKTGLTGDLTSYWVTPEDLYFGSPAVQNMPGVDPSARAFIHIYSPAHITLIDPLGRRTGFDSTSGGEVNEIPGALYSGADAQIESITVAGLGSPEGWRLLATGYASGPYTLETGYLNARTRNWVTRATTAEGEIDEYPVRPPNYPSYLPLLLR